MKTAQAIILGPEDFTNRGGSLKQEAFQALFSGALVIHNGKVLNFNQGTLPEIPDASSTPPKTRKPRQARVTPVEETPSQEGSTNTHDTPTPEIAGARVPTYEEDLADSVREV